MQQHKSSTWWKHEIIIAIMFMPTEILCLGNRSVFPPDSKLFADKFAFCLILQMPEYWEMNCY